MSEGDVMDGARLVHLVHAADELARRLADAGFHVVETARYTALVAEVCSLRERVATLEDGLRGLVDDYTPPDHWRIGEEMAVPTDRLRDLLDGGAS